MGEPPAPRAKVAEGAVRVTGDDFASRLERAVVRSALGPNLIEINRLKGEYLSRGLANSCICGYGNLDADAQIYQIVALCGRRLQSFFVTGQLQGSIGCELIPILSQNRKTQSHSLLI
jgi:hypothetical protein